MNLLEYDIIEKILLKIHRFNYLGNISKINKELNKITNNVMNIHYNNLNNVLKLNIKEENNNNENNLDKNIWFYNNISKYLFNYKILNLKYYNFIKEFNLSNFIKIIILYNKNCSTKKKNLFIIDDNDYINYLKVSPNNFIPFMIIYIKTGYSLHLEYNNKLNSYRLCLNNPLNKLSLTKIVKLEDIIEIISFTENRLFTFIYKNYLLKFFK